MPIVGLREASIDIKIKVARPEPPDTGEPAHPPVAPSPESGEAAPLAAKPASARLLLVRHGQSTWNRERRMQGQLDPPLSEEGRRQAEQLGRRLVGRRLAGFYSSDLKRALETAEVIGSQIGVPPTPSVELREIFLGEWEGLMTEELARRYPVAWARWAEELDWDLIPGGEGAALFESRVSAALDAILAQHQTGDVLVVTHGGVIQVALHRVIGRSSRGFFPFKLQNASISVLERRNGGKIVIAGVNDIGHLDAVLAEGADFE